MAQKGLDIHFTDKEMNRRLVERKNELAIEREGQSFSAHPLPTADAEVQRILSDPAMRRLYMSDEQKQREWNATPEQYEDVRAKISGEIEVRIRERIAAQPVAVQSNATAADKPTHIKHEGVLLEHGSAPYNFKPDMTKPEGERDDSYYVKLQGNNGKEKVVWGVTRLC
ncbi:hypothetical protein [Symbiopectobacterium purcellii]|uniref:Uncharacterized protein n=1 Tax=Symbiopectobacterium purcellii TaxID=2871826 RepID=A0ABX9AR27_9ENTR|nr:hypothetical protein [Symbiopectobacterium purcellii]QZN95450.1 hypothetical protein K6K13_20100 [Symbiopectobacterium purcellii]